MQEDIKGLLGEDGLLCQTHADPIMSAFNYCPMNLQSKPVLLSILIEGDQGTAGRGWGAVPDARGPRHCSINIQSIIVPCRFHRRRSRGCWVRMGCCIRRTLTSSPSATSSTLPSPDSRTPASQVRALRRHSSHISSSTLLLMAAVRGLLPSALEAGRSSLCSLLAHWCRDT